MAFIPTNIAGFPIIDGGATVVHCRGVHRARGHGDDGEGGGGDTEEATGRGADGGGRF